MSPNKPPRNRPGRGTTLTASNETLQVGDVPPVSTAPFQQPPGPAPAAEPEKAQTPEPAVEPEHAATEETPVPSRKTSGQGKPERGNGPARQAWEASVILARTDPRGWDPYSVRLPEQLWARLEERVVADQASYRIPTLAMSHYINAALGRIPEDAADAAALAQEQLASQGLRPPETRSSGTRLHKQVLARMELLPAQLRRVARPGLLGHLQTAVIAAFLDELDAG